jgi:hypothetical protein
MQMIADTIQQEMPAPEAGSGVDRVMRPVRSAKEAGRKVVLATVGACAYLVDGAAAVYGRGTRLFSSAERRGQRMSREVTKRFGDLEEQAVGEMRKLQEQAEGSVDNLSGIGDGHSLDEYELEKRVELVLANLGLPSRERLERLSHEIDDLNQKIDQQLQRLPSQPLADPLG